MNEYTFRTFRHESPPWERAFADALFSIMDKGVHDSDGIVEALNRNGIQTREGGSWSNSSFQAELSDLGAWTNAVGAAQGSHEIPCISQQAHHV